VLVVTADFIEHIVNFDADTLAFVLAHELGHHVLGHLTTNRLVAFENFETVQRRQELAADEYAIKLMLQAGFTYRDDVRDVLELAAN
jgi:Zn-dependent protease with chaperone function